MKKILTHLTGIILLIVFLIAGGCKKEMAPPAAEYLTVVHIFLKAVEGEHHLEMYDSNDLDNVVTDSLKTSVQDLTEVYWVLAPSSGLKKIIWVKPDEYGNKIMPVHAEGWWRSTKYKKHVVPGNQIPGDSAKYKIKVKDENNKKWEIDPYLIIP